MTIKTRLFSLVFVLVGLFGIDFFLWLYFIQPVNRIQYEAQALSHLSMAISDLEEVINGMQTRNLPEAAAGWPERLARYEAAEKLMAELHLTMSPDSKIDAAFTAILNLKAMTEQYMPVLVSALEELAAEPQFHALPTSRTIWTVFQDQANRINPRYDASLFYRLLLIDDLCAKLMETLPTVRTVISRQEQIITAEVRRLEDLGTMVVSLAFVAAVLFALFLSTRLARSILAENQRNLKEITLAKEAVEQADRAKGAFLANMSHEIRTPMNAILGMGHLIRNTGLTERQNYYIESIHTAGQHLLALLNDILDYSKIEAGHLALEHIPFSAGTLVEDVLRIQGGAAEKKGIDLLYSPAPDVPAMLTGDPARLSQVLMNLVGNGIKFTHRGFVRLAVCPESGTGNQWGLRFDIADSGIGMTDQQLSQLFKPFVQADPSVTRQFGGTGLGLAISTQLCRLMGGWLRAQSKPEQGSCFTFWLPFDKPVQSIHVQDTEAQKAIHGLHTLVVGDRPEAMEALMAVTRAIGLNATASRTDQAATLIGNAGKNPFRLVLLDWGMLSPPKAAELMRRISAASTPAPPVLVATTAANAPAATSLVALGVTRVLAVPVLPSTLYDAVTATPGITAASPVLKNGHQVYRFGGNKIVLAEDNNMNQQVALELLTEAGLCPTLATNGEEALSLALSGNFELILMDIQMPVMDGLEACRMLRLAEADGRPRTPVIAMTAHATAEDEARSRAAGMDSHVVKPIDPKQLFETIAHWIPLQELVSAPALPCSIPSSTRQPPSVAACEGILERLLGPLAQQAPLECRTLIDELAAAGLPTNNLDPLRQLVGDFHFGQALVLVHNMLDGIRKADAP